MGLANLVLSPRGRKTIFDLLLHRVHVIVTLLLLAGVSWLFVLPLNEYNLGTRISENALLPGQVHTYFGGSDYKVLNALRNEIRHWVSTNDDEVRLAGLEQLFSAAGLKSARQRYSVTSASKSYRGTNLYALLEAPRGDATEALVLNAAWTDSMGNINEGGVTQLVALARYFRRWAMWSKDIIFVIPYDKAYGSQAWLDAYHDNNDRRYIESLNMTAGAIQAAIDIDFFGSENRFDYLNIKFDGTNGQLANLDLVNSAIHIAQTQIGVRATVQGELYDDYYARVKTIARMLSRQASGLPSGSHSPYIPYRIDAISLSVRGNGNGEHDDATLGRSIESMFRTLNNILEHLHQSFFLYLLINTHRFVSIATYLPSAMMIANCYTVVGLTTYIRTQNSNVSTSSRDYFFAILILGLSHILGLGMFYFIAIQPEALFFPVMAGQFVISLAIPPLCRLKLSKGCAELVDSFAKILIGMFLTALATINFSLALIISLCAFPLNFSTSPKGINSSPLKALLLQIANPFVVLFIVSGYLHLDVAEIVQDAFFGFSFMHVWTPLAIFGIWWPAFLCSQFEGDEDKEEFKNEPLNRSK